MGFQHSRSYVPNKERKEKKRIYYLREIDLDFCLVAKIHLLINYAKFYKTSFPKTTNSFLDQTKELYYKMLGNHGS